MKYKLTVFTLNGCGHCMLLKTNLDHLKIPYKEVEVSKNESTWNQIVEQTKQNRLPTVYLAQEGKDEGKIYIPEIDFKSIDEIVNEIKNYF